MSIPQRSLAAHAAVQEWLDVTAVLFMDGDWDAFQTHFSYPHTIRTHSDTLVFSDGAEYTALIANARNLLLARDMTSYLRIVKSAGYSDDTRIIAVWETNILAGAVRLEKPFPARGTFRVEMNRLFCEMNIYGLDGGTTWHFPEVIEDPDWTQIENCD